MRRQTDQDFSLWIVLTGLDRTRVAGLAGDRAVTWVDVPGDATIGAVRQQGFAPLAASASAVVFADCDDVLEPARRGRCARALAGADVVACGMRLIDEGGDDLGLVFTRPRAPPRISPG